MKYQRLIAAFGVSVAVAGPVHAETNWTGFYLGGTLGLGSGDVLQTSTPAALRNTVSMNGAVGGAFAGDNAQRGSLVFGIEADAMLSGIDGTLAAAAGRTCFGGTADCHQGIDQIYTARARVGVAMGDFLPYVTAGIAGANIAQKRNPPTDVAGFETSFVAGLGVDYRLSENVSVRAEYLTMDFGPQSRNIGAFVNTNDTGRLNVFRIGAAFHF
jgi:outer membrane immunogenic protein